MNFQNFLQLNSYFIPLLKDITFKLLNLLRLNLQPSMWSVLENAFKILFVFAFILYIYFILFAFDILIKMFLILVCIYPALSSLRLLDMQIMFFFEFGP